MRLHSHRLLGLLQLKHHGWFQSVYQLPVLLATSSHFAEQITTCTVRRSASVRDCIWLRLQELAWWSHRFSANFSVQTLSPNCTWHYRRYVSYICFFLCRRCSPGLCTAAEIITIALKNRLSPCCWSKTNWMDWKWQQELTVPPAGSKEVWRFPELLWLLNKLDQPGSA